MNFGQYYNYYLTLNENPKTRLLHCLGNIATLCFIVCVFLKEASLWWLLLSPFIVYPFAWSGHRFCEGNTPAAFKAPIKAKLCDWRMMWDMMRGKLK